MRRRGADRVWGPLVDLTRAPRPSLKAALRSVTAIGVGHRAVLGLLTLLGDSSHRRIPPLCRCQGGDDTPPGAEARLPRSPLRARSWSSLLTSVAATAGIPGEGLPDIASLAGPQARRPSGGEMSGNTPEIDRMG